MEHAQIGSRDTSTRFICPQTFLCLILMERPGKNGIYHERALQRLWKRGLRILNTVRLMFQTPIPIRILSGHLYLSLVVILTLLIARGSIKDITHWQCLKCLIDTANYDCF
ncbi:hypothetical protein FRC18_008188 [Serendipita sp. 400]|nr:hypothetical protein FRC18_008188 [Serendipita sp. 400]